jgi:quercetin dioxygenase-like cupin family protein
MSNQARHYRWSELPADRPMALLSRRRIIGERAMLSEVRLEKGCEVPEHAHPNEQFAIVLSGRLRFVLGPPEARRVLEVGAGETLLIPSNVPHAATALEETLVLDVFSPPSEKTGIDQR